MFCQHRLFKGTLSAFQAKLPPPAMTTNQCHDPTRLSTGLQPSIERTRASPGASRQYPAFSLTGAQCGVYRIVRWRSTQGSVPRFSAVPGPFVAVPGLVLAASRLYDDLSTLWLWENICATHSCNSKANVSFSRSIFWIRS